VPIVCLLFAGLAILLLRAGTADAGVVHDVRPVADGAVSPGFAFEFLAVSWDTDSDHHDHDHAGEVGSVRVMVDGSWGAWQSLREEGAQAPGQWSSALMATRGAEAYEVSGVPDWAIDPQVMVLTLGTSADELTLLGDEDSCVSRAEWGADESKRFVGDVESWPTTFYPAEGLIVHHTVTANDDPSPAATVRAIYHQHTILNDWGDIGYHYMIDEDGRIYEGRWSGTASTPCSGGGNGSDFAHDADGKVVTAGHTGYHNQGNIGIAMLGNFASAAEYPEDPDWVQVDPTVDAAGSLTELLVDLAARHDIDPLGTWTYANPMCDLPPEDWEWDCANEGLPYFPDVERDLVSGHRDWRSTACPGAALYAMLPQVRNAVYAELHRPVISVDADPLVLERNASDGYVGPLSGVTATDPDGDDITLTNNAPDVIPIGTSVITWTATDTTALSADAEQTVTVIYTFTDDDESVFESDIEWMATNGITRGCNPPANDEFCPEDFVTRGQMAAFLVRALDLPAAPSAGFTDTVGTTFEKDIDKLAAAGITKGCNPPDNDRFCPDDKVRREVMAAFLVRALKYTDDGGGDLFTDDDSSIFETDIDKLATAGVTKGCNPPANDEFCPTRNVTRGQMAAFLHRALGD